MSGVRGPRAVPDGREGAMSTGPMQEPDDRGDASSEATEQQVLDMALEGLPNKTIALRLGVSIRTVERRRAAALRRIGAATLVEAAGLLSRQGRASSGTFDALFATAVPAAMIDRERFVAVNAGLCNLLGLGCEDLVGKPYWDLVSPHEVSPAQADLAGLFTGETLAYRAERDLTLPDGTLRVSVVMTPVWSDDELPRFALAQVLRAEPDGTRLTAADEGGEH